MEFYQILFVWLAIHAAFLLVNIERYDWLQQLPHSHQSPLRYLIPLGWVLGFIFTSIAIAMISINNPPGILEMFTKGFCLTYNITFTLANKAIYSYSKPHIGLIFAAGSCSQCFVLMILAGIRDILGGVFVMPGLTITVVAQFLLSFKNFREGKVKGPEQERFDLTNIDADIINSYLTRSGK